MKITNWIYAYRKQLKFDIKSVTINQLTDWAYSINYESIDRKDKAFFSVKAIKSDTNVNGVFESPLIDQPEIGILGFILCKNRDGLNVLLQAKSEPGNTYVTQIGPSVQATESNYKSKHKGKPQKYIDFFLDGRIQKTTSLKQSEQGSRFLNKYNLNAIVIIDQTLIKVDDNKYKWYSIEDITSNINSDFLFNTDFKSVFSHLIESLILKTPSGKRNTPFLKSYFLNTNSDINSIINFINRKREEEKFNTATVKLNKLEEWVIEPTGINPKNEKSFGFNYYNIEISDREVPSWGQPLITKKSKENIISLFTEDQGQFLFAFKIRKEIGFKNYLQLAPTHQYDISDDASGEIIEGECIIEFLQSEEGGRFYKNISKYSLYKIESFKGYFNNEDFIILNVYELFQLLKIEGIFTNEARTLISSLVSMLR